MIDEPAALSVDQTKRPRRTRNVRATTDVFTLITATAELQHRKVVRVPCGGRDLGKCVCTNSSPGSRSTISFAGPRGLSENRSKKFGRPAAH